MYSTTEGIESAVFKAQGKMVEIWTQQIISCDTTDDDCIGGDLITVFNYVMDAESIDCDVGYPESSNGECGGSSDCCCFYHGSEQAMRLDELEESMKCSYQSVYKFDQSSLQVEGGYETGRFVFVQGRVRFFSAYHTRSQVLQIQQGTWDDQQSHYSLEGGGLGRCRTQGFVWYWTDNEHTNEKGKDRNRGKSSCYCGRAQGFDGNFGNGSGETPGVSSSRSLRRTPIRGQTVPWHRLGNSFFRSTRTRGCAYPSLHQYDLGGERSAERFFRGVHEHTFARYRIHQAAHWSSERQPVRLEIAEGAQWSKEGISIVFKLPVGHLVW